MTGADIYWADFAHTFLNRLWADSEGYAIVSVGIEPRWDHDANSGAGALKHQHFKDLKHRWPDDGEILIAKAFGYARRHDVYVRPTLSVNASRAKTKRQGKDAQVTVPARFGWADVDTWNDELQAKWQSIVNAAGAGWAMSSGRGRHLYLDLGRPHEHDELEAMNRRFGAAFGADSKWAANALLRLPGTFWHKDRVRSGGALRRVVWA